MTAFKEIHLPDLCIIPLYVRKNKNISESLKIYFGELYAFSMKYGYAWVTDEQLAKMKEVNITTIERWNKELEKEGLIRRETKNKNVENIEGKFKWKKTRRIYFTIPQSLDEGIQPEEEILPDTEPLKNEGIIEPLKNEGIIEPLKNEGLTNNLKDKQNTKPSPVIFSSLSKIRIDESLAIKISEENSEDVVNQAVERCLSWKARPSDKVGILTAISKKNDWQDRESLEQVIEKNKEFLKSISHMDSTNTRFGMIYIGPNYFQVANYNSTAIYLSIEEPDFILRAKDFLLKVKGE